MPVSKKRKRPRKRTSPTTIPASSGYVSNVDCGGINISNGLLKGFRKDGKRYHASGREDKASGAAPLTLNEFIIKFDSQEPAPTPALDAVLLSISQAQHAQYLDGYEGKAFELIQEDWQRSQLRVCLDDCMSGMPPDQVDTLRARYYSGKTLQSIADDIGTNRERVRQLEAKALRHMRKPQNARWLRPLLESGDCHGYGLMAFKNRGYVSKVEVLAGAW